MRATPPFSLRRLAAFLALLTLVSPGRTAEEGWIDLTSDAKTRAALQGMSGDWLIGGDAGLDPKNPRRLVAKPGEGVLVNGVKGRLRNLTTREKYRDLDVHVEFLIPKGSNSGVKLMGLYEIQILDSRGRKKLSGDACGGIYPRAEYKPRYHHIDEGVPPRTDAARKPGEWQTLDIEFTAPRFDASGKKVRNARFVKVILNGEVVHENVDVAYPTGAAWSRSKEIASGPLLLQADHGPVAFRNVRIRPRDIKAEKR